MDEMDFETAYARLEETVRALEAGGLSLEQSVALFEEGVRLAEYCNARLDAAHLRVSKLIDPESGTQPGGQMRLGSMVVELQQYQIQSERSSNE